MAQQPQESVDSGDRQPGAGAGHAPGFWALIYDDEIIVCGDEDWAEDWPESS